MTDRDPIAQALEDLRKKEAEAELIKSAEQESIQRFEQRGYDVQGVYEVDLTSPRRDMLNALRATWLTENARDAAPLPGKPARERILVIHVRDEGPKGNAVAIPTLINDIERIGYRFADLDEALALLSLIGMPAGGECAAFSSRFEMDLSRYGSFIRWNNRTKGPNISGWDTREMNSMDDLLGTACLIPLIRSSATP